MIEEHFGFFQISTLDVMDTKRIEDDIDRVIVNGGQVSGVADDFDDVGDLNPFEHHRGDIQNLNLRGVMDIIVKVSAVADI
ncbi:MAG: hypothetical protein SCM96_11610 [Acidobacteriota bacterium]|nr:hypothetical protein [Acidobacteriota bacterium]